MKLCLIIAAFLILNNSAPAQASCGSGSSVRLDLFVRNYSATSNSIIGWPGYEWNQANFVVIDSDSSAKCAFVRSPKYIGFRELVVAPTILNGIYGFCGFDQAISCASLGSDFANAVVWNLANPGNQIASAIGISPDILQFQQLVHESFHLFGQYVNPGKGTWPNTIGDIDFNARKEIKDKCYSANAEVSELVSYEIEALFSAYRSVQDKMSTAHTQIELLRFLEARSKRYRLLSSATVRIGNLSCEEAENRIEMIEGVPEFASYKALLGSNILNLADVEKLDRAFLNMNVPGDFGPYYVMGAWQALIISSFENGLFKFVSRANSTKAYSLKAEIMLLSSANAP